MGSDVVVVADFLNENKDSILSLLPSNVPKDKFVDVARVAAIKNSDLGLCTQESLFTAFSDCAKDGLLPDNREACIVVYPKKSGNLWIKEAVYQPMVAGVIKKLTASDDLLLISAKAVYIQDEFDYFFDMTGENLMFRPDFSSENRIDENIKLTFAYAKLKNGETLVEVMTKNDVDKIMYTSKSAVDKATGKIKDYSAWYKHYSEMSIKTAIHRLAKRLQLPSSPDAMRMLERSIDSEVITVKELPSQTMDNEAFSGYLLKYGKAVVNGKKSPEDMIIWLESKCKLTDDQKMEVIALKEIKHEDA